MIKTNLLVSGKSHSDRAFVGGIDFSLLNWKLILLSLLLFFGVDILKDKIFDAEINVTRQEIEQIKNQKKQIAKQLDSVQQIKKEIEEIKKDEEIVAQKIQILQKILQYKRNPLKVLVFIAQNMPKKMWLESMNIKGNAFSLKGKARDYKDIGAFIDVLNSSTFFNKGIKLESNKTEDLGTVRNELFVLSGQIVSWE